VFSSPSLNTWVGQQFGQCATQQRTQRSSALTTRYRLQTAVCIFELSDAVQSLTAVNLASSETVFIQEPKTGQFGQHHIRQTQEQESGLFDTNHSRCHFRSLGVTPSQRVPQHLYAHQTTQIVRSTKVLRQCFGGSSKCSSSFVQGLRAISRREQILGRNQRIETTKPSADLPSDRE
jgi:hypothetical protein